MRLLARRALAALLPLPLVLTLVGAALAQVGYEDRVQDTTTTSGTGSYTLSASPPTGKVAFASAFATGCTVRYFVTDGGSRWEDVTGVFTSPTTLSRVVIEANSAGTTSAISWPDNTAKTVFVSPSARDVVYQLPSYLGTSGGSANAQTLTPCTVLHARRAFYRVRFEAGFTNTGATTLTISGIAFNVKKYTPHGGKVALTGYEIVAGAIYDLTDDGTDLLLPGSTASALSVLNASLTPASTGANTSATVLQTYTMPASTLIQTGMKLRVRASGTTANNANNKTLSLAVGSGTYSTSGALNGGWFLEFELNRTGLNTQYLLTSGQVTVGGVPVLQIVNSTTSSQTETNTMVISLTATNGVATASDITCSELRVTLERTGF